MIDCDLIKELLAAAKCFELREFATLGNQTHACYTSRRRNGYCVCSQARGAELETKMCIAIVDSGANLKAFHRMDDAWVGSIDIAIKKAKTAVFFGMPTGQIGKLSQPGDSLFGIEHSTKV